jgi:DNA-binding NarL/FixJ family response regulator
MTLPSSIRHAPIGVIAIAIPTSHAERRLPLAYPLTKKELEVAQLVAQGMTNREIAANLFNSERTIDNHVQHIYNKLGIDSRAELALWLRDHGLLPAPPGRKLS